MLSGKTVLFGLFGYPVKHTFSPGMHNSAFCCLNIDAVYLPFEIKPENLKPALKSLIALNFKGVNITVPYKQKCIKYLDQVDAKAALIGAVNTVKVSNGRLIGYNTDSQGFIMSLRQRKVTLKGKNILILGSGGASRAIASGMVLEQDKPEKIFIFDLEDSLSKKLTAHLNKIKKNTAVFVNKDQLPNVVSRADILINATPVGLKGNKMPLKPELITSNLSLVYDLIYNPSKTALLKIAEKKGIPAVNGMDMLIYQGAFSFKIWTGINPPFENMKKSVCEQIKEV